MSRNLSEQTNEKAIGSLGFGGRQLARRPGNALTLTQKGGVLTQNGVSSTKTTPWNFAGIPLGGTGAGTFSGTTGFTKNASFDGIAVAATVGCRVRGYVDIQPVSSTLLPLTMELRLTVWTTGVGTPGVSFDSAIYFPYLLPSGANVAHLDAGGDTRFRLNMDGLITATANKSYAIWLSVRDGAANWAYNAASLVMRRDPPST